MRYEIHTATTLIDTTTGTVVDAPTVECPECHEEHHVIRDTDVPVMFLTHRTAYDKQPRCEEEDLTEVRNDLDRIRRK